MNESRSATGDPQEHAEQPGLIERMNEQQIITEQPTRLLQQQKNEAAGKRVSILVV